MTTTPTTVPAAGTITLSCLGVPLAVPAALAERCRHLPRSAAEPWAAVHDDGGDGVAELTATAVGLSELLTVHAAVVAAADGALVVPAASGAGKSTLTAALVRRGFGYVSDEVLAVDRATGLVTAFARPIALHAASWDVVALPAPRPAPGGEQFVDPAALGFVSTAPTRVAHVVLPDRRDHRRGEHRPALTALGPGQVFAALVPRCFNHFKDTTGSLAALRTIATTATGVLAEYSDANTLADLLAARLGLPAGSTDGPRNPDQRGLAVNRFSGA